MDRIAVVRIADGVMPDLSALIRLASTEGHGFVERTRSEWAAGANRFDRAGEGFFLARDGAQLVGMCGLNVDPFIDDPTVGRIRHLYVAPEFRGQGLGRRLVGACLDLARAGFVRVRLRTFDPRAALFYEAIGFNPVDEPEATHAAVLGDSRGPPADVSRS